MADHAHSSTPSEVPAELIARAQHGWDFFTKATFWNCVAVAALLFAMLVGLVLIK